MAEIINQPWTDSKIAGDSDSKNSASDNKNHDSHNNKSGQSGQGEKDVKDHELNHERVDRESDCDCSAGERVFFLLDYGGRFGLEVIYVLDGLFF